MRTFSGLIDELGGPIILKDGLGIEDSHARTMKARDSIPVEHWPKLIELARSRGVAGVSYDSLHAMRAYRLASKNGGQAA